MGETLTHIQNPALVILAVAVTYFLAFTRGESIVWKAVALVLLGFRGLVWIAAGVGVVSVFLVIVTTQKARELWRRYW